MKTYIQIKPSVYTWLHDIPAHWEELFLEQVCKEKCIKNVGNKENLVLSLSYGRIIRKKNVYAGLVAKDFATYQIVKANDIILRFTDLQNDHTSLRTGLVTETGIITAAYTCITPTINSPFLHYLLHAYDLRKVFYGMGGGVRQSIGFKDVRHMYVPIPPRIEQDQIVRFLDWKVSEINKLIRIKQQQIECHKEKLFAVINSLVIQGIGHDVSLTTTNMDWAPEIPAHWTTSRIRNHFIILKRIAGSEGYDVYSVTQQGLKVRDVTVYEGQLAADYSGYQFVYPGEFAMNHMDLLTGGVGIANHLGVTSPDYRVFKLLDTEHCYDQYYLRVFQLCYRRHAFYRFGRGAATVGRWRLPATAFKNFEIPVPPYAEQVEIVRAIDAEEVKTHRAIDCLTKQIEVLKELKARLIADVATGKMDIRDVVVPDYEFVGEDVSSETDADEIEPETETEEDC